MNKPNPLLKDIENKIQLNKYFVKQETKNQDRYNY